MKLSNPFSVKKRALRCLKAARDLIAPYNRWTLGVMHDFNRDTYCAVGALRQTCLGTAYGRPAKRERNRKYQYAINALAAAFPFTDAANDPELAVIGFNDALFSDTTMRLSYDDARKLQHPRVVALFDVAIAQLERN